jgi:hypothetical protein
VWRSYGDLHLALAFTAELTPELLECDEDAFKVVHNWQKNARPLSTGDFGATLVAGRCEHRNVAVCLRASNLFGVDIDGPDGRELARKIAPAGFPETVAVESGRDDGGAHLWYRLQQGAKAKAQLAGKVTLSRDGYLMAPPSWHFDGRASYRFAPGRAPWEHEIAPFPTRLYERLLEHDRRDDKAARADDSSTLGKGDRHPHMKRIAGAMRYAGAGEEAILAALRSENERRCDPLKADEELRRLAHWTCGFPPGARVP